MIDILSVKFQFNVTQFEGLLTTLFGYILIAVSLILLHGVASVAFFAKYVFESLYKIYCDKVNVSFRLSMIYLYIEY